MKRTCEIKWVNAYGNPTPDQNEAIGEVWVTEHVEQIYGRGVRMPESRHFAICAAHAKQLQEPGMHFWQFRRYPSEELAARYRWHRANPRGAYEVGFDAKIAHARAKAEMWANANEVVVEWVMGDERGEYRAVVYSSQRRVLAAIDGYEWADVNNRAAEAAVLADAQEWCEDLAKHGFVATEAAP